MRLVPLAVVPRALSIIFSGVSVATIAVSPLGSYFVKLIEWRNVFQSAASIGVLSLVCQAATLPAMALSGSTRLRKMIDMLMRPNVGLGILGTIPVLTGYLSFSLICGRFSKAWRALASTGCRPSCSVTVW